MSPARRTQLIVIGVFVALIAVVAIVIGVTGSDDGDGDGGSGGDFSADSATVEETFGEVLQSGTFLGDPNASVVVTEFVDMQCPFCAEFATNALPDVIDRHVANGEIAMELRVIAFLGSDSEEAAEVAAAAALQNRLWQFADMFFLNQGPENSGYVTDDFLADLADATPGLDGSEALEQRDSPEARAQLDENESLAQRLGVDSTPSFYISVEGSDPQPLELDELTAEAFSQAIRSAPRGE